MELAELGFALVAYPFTLVAAKLRSIRETLRALKGSMPVGAPPTILCAEEVCKGVGFTRYWVYPLESPLSIADCYDRISSGSMLAM